MLCALALASCAEDEAPVSPAGEDSGASQPEGDEGAEALDHGVDLISPDSSSDFGSDPGPVEPPGFTAASAALLLDFDMRPRASWLPAIAALEKGGLSVTYRRWFPHPTPADTTAGTESGQHPYSVLLVAGGAGPAQPTERMRVGSEAPLVSFVSDGGTLVLLPRNGWRDAVYSEAEWLHFNRVLEALQVPVRIERNTLIGTLFVEEDGKPPLHADTAYGYAGSLEWNLSLPWGFACKQLGSQLAQWSFPAGYVPTLACDGDEVHVLAVGHGDAIVWQGVGAAEDKLIYSDGHVRSRYWLRWGRRGAR